MRPLSHPLPEEALTLHLLSDAQRARIGTVLAAMADAHLLTQAERAQTTAISRAIGDHLQRHPHFSGMTTGLRMHGSARLGTLIRRDAVPAIDFALSIEAGAERSISARELLGNLHEALTEWQGERTLMMRSRCVEVQCRDIMRLRITAVAHHPAVFLPYGESLGRAPDYTSNRYCASNPAGYARWFNDAAGRLAASQFMPFKRPLEQAMQLFKLHRDAMFAQHRSLQPSSMVVTTLIASLPTYGQRHVAA